MKRFNAQGLLLLLIVFFCHSCGNQPENKKEYVTGSQGVISSLQDGFIPEVPEPWFPLKSDRRLHIEFIGEEVYASGDEKYILHVFEKQQDLGWYAINSAIISDEYKASLDDIEVVNLGRKEYLYFEEYHRGGSMGNFDVYFTLFDIYSHDVLYIHYINLPEGVFITNTFINSDNLSTRSEEYAYLQNKVERSEKIHKPGIVELLSEKFQEKNDIDVIFYYLIEQTGNEMVSFSPVITDEELFDVAVKQDWNYLRNDDFIITMQFRGPLLGYDIRDKKYLILWTPRSMYHMPEKMEFDDAGNILLWLDKEEKPSLIINPYDFTYSK